MMKNCRWKIRSSICSSAAAAAAVSRWNCKVQRCVVNVSVAREDGPQMKILELIHFCAANVSVTNPSQALSLYSSYYVSLWLRDTPAVAPTGGTFEHPSFLHLGFFLNYM